MPPRVWLSSIILSAFAKIVQRLVKFFKDTIFYFQTSWHTTKAFINIKANYFHHTFFDNVMNYAGGLYKSVWVKPPPPYWKSIHRLLKKSFHPPARWSIAANPSLDGLTEPIWRMLWRGQVAVSKTHRTHNWLHFSETFTIYVTPSHLIHRGLPRDSKM